MTYDRLRTAALALGAVTEAPHHHFESFRVDGRIFATVPPGREHVHLFVDADERELALVTDADCVDKLTWGGKVVGIRVRLAAARPAAVERWLRQAYEHKAGGPRRRRSAG